MQEQARKKLRPEPSFEDYHKQWSQLYEGLNYEQGLAAYFMNKSHEWCEKPFGADMHFERVVEVGAGTGVHLKTIKHSVKEYYLTDYSDESLAKAKENINVDDYDFTIKFQQEDASKLSLPDDFCDRLIGTHVLEHLLNPHLVLQEWARVVKPGGVISIILPTDPGFAWRLGRRVGGRSAFIKAGIDYDYWMAREHVNPLNNLVSFINYYFEDVKSSWHPLRIPSMDANLFYICHIKV